MIIVIDTDPIRVRLGQADFGRRRAVLGTFEAKKLAKDSSLGNWFLSDSVCPPSLSPAKAKTPTMDLTWGTRSHHHTMIGAYFTASLFFTQVAQTPKTGRGGRDLGRFVPFEALKSCFWLLLFPPVACGLT